MRDFLTDNGPDNAAVLPEVDLKVMLPDQTCKTIKVERHLPTTEVLDMILHSLQIPTAYFQHFGLFETVENNFGKPIARDMSSAPIAMIQFQIGNCHRTSLHLPSMLQILAPPRPHA